MNKARVAEAVRGSIKQKIKYLYLMENDTALKNAGKGFDRGALSLDLLIRFISGRIRLG